MSLSSLHLLLTYQCTLACDHCFVWGSPWQRGTMTLRQIREILNQARALGTIDGVCFEGGEPFLYYGTLRTAVHEAAWMGFSVGIVTNGYWATGVEDAVEWLRPLEGKLSSLSVSSDTLHWGEPRSDRERFAQEAAERLGIDVGTMRVASPEDAAAQGASGIMYRGRAAANLAPDVPHHPWDQFAACPHEDLRDPSRVHVDPFGHMHLCQGLSMGNLFAEPLEHICQRFDPDADPVIGPLLAGGPAELVRRHDLPLTGEWADACHLCDAARRALRTQFPDILTPDAMYGEP